MQKLLNIIGIMVLFFAAYIFLSQEKYKNAGIFSEPESFGSDINLLEGNIANSATSTTSDLPVKVLDNNSARQYAKIMNDSDTAVYLYLGNFASPSAASTSVAINKGVRLNANGGEYVIESGNLWFGQVWATSTAASKGIIYLEK